MEITATRPDFFDYLSKLRQIKRQGQPTIYVTRSGTEYVKASELVESDAGKLLLEKLAKIPLAKP